MTYIITLNFKIILSRVGLKAHHSIKLAFQTTFNILKKKLKEFHKDKVFHIHKQNSLKKYMIGMTG